ncbi:MAG: Ig-like domain-containing protein, partial [Candidatus Geothermincolia bacterium]
IGVTGSQPGFQGTARFFSYTPGDAALSSLGNLGMEYEANALVSGPGGTLYCGTGPSGQLFSRATGVTAFTPVAGWPASLSGKAVGSLAASADAVYGCAGGDGSLFKYAPASGFTDEGPITTDNAGVTAATTDSLGKIFFGTTGNGTAGSVKLVRYDPTAAFTWLTAGADKSTSPPVRTATVNLRNVADDADIQNDIGGIAAPTPIGGVTDRSLRFKALMETTDSTVTPTVTEWEATWRVDAAVDLFEYPYAEGVYPGEDLGIWGSGFGAAGSVKIGGLDAVTGIWQPNYIRVQVPAGATGNAIEITPADGGGHASTTFNLLSPPNVTQVSPTHARQGDFVDIHGSGFLAARGAEDSVSFNGVSATAFSSWSDSLIRVQVPQGATTGPASVSVNYHASNQVEFTVDGGGGPTVNITAPADGAALTGTVSVAATVQRSGGTSPVEFWVDGTKAGSDASAPYTFSWNADAVADGAHALTVKATDNYSRVGSDTVTVYVDHTVPSASTHWYFAEGCTDYGFETWLLIGNPQNESAIAQVTFMDDTGETYKRACDLPPNSRTTLNAADVAPGRNVSIQVSTDRAVVCERAMYWQNRIEGHSTIGSTAMSRTWYFAEGSTDWGFETYVLLCNPGDAKVKTTVTYLFTDGTTAARDHELAPHSRLTVDAASEVGARDFSVRVDAGAPGIVAERSVYHGGRRCGTNTIGCKEASLTWFLSEGSTDWGFETWLLIQRPGSGDARVTATYRMDDGRTVQRIYDVKGNSRFTVDLSREVGVADVSTQVTSDVPVVCERSMYWNGRAAGHCTIGAPGPGRTWFLAEGCTDYGFETWVLLDNPSASAVTATVTFLKGDGSSVPVALTLQPLTRVSLDASVYVGAASFSTSVAAASPIMVERAMYWQGRSGGTGSIGAR